LWFTRFHKSRALATQAVGGGKVKLNGERVKPAHVVRVGDRISVSQQYDTLELDVVALPLRRGPATEAQKCYAETAESLQRRNVNREQRRIADQGVQRSEGRPDKRERRQLEKLRRNNQT
jgi:ribosome-associated heat shock protein Hsp15